MSCYRKRVVALTVTLATCPFSHVGAEMVPPAYHAVARENGVPAPLLYAVALTESGQSRLSQNQPRPWPWTLNIAGQGHYFPSRKAAWLALNQALEAGKTPDVGLMQINWGYHQSELGAP